MSHSWIRSIDYTHVSFLNQKHRLHPCLIPESEALTTLMSHFWIRNIDYTHVSFLNQKHWLHPCFIPESETLTAPCSLRITRYYLVVSLFQLKFTTEKFVAPLSCLKFTKNCNCTLILIKNQNRHWLNPCLVWFILRNN